MASQRVTPQERARAGRIVAERAELLGMTQVVLARRAGVDRKTLRALIAGNRWPTVTVRGRLEDVLEWPRGEILRQARDGLEALAVYSDYELASELARRARARESVG